MKADSLDLAKARIIRHPMRVGRTNNGLLIKLANY